jgi:hypothetical protein
MRAPVVMVGDGALGLWRALREVFPATREQRCWVHKVANVLAALPKSVQAGARRALNEILGAEDRAHAERAIQALVTDYGAKWPKAVAKVVGRREGRPHTPAALAPLEDQRHGVAWATGQATSSWGRPGELGLAEVEVVVGDGRRR